MTAARPSPESIQPGRTVPGRAMPRAGRRTRRGPRWLRGALFVLCVLLSACDDTSTPRETTDQRLIPWLGADNTFGLATPEGHVVVTPRFVDARPGRHGIAPVAVAEDRWGVADAAGHMVVSAKYAAVELLGTATAPLVLTKREYNAWWQFWNWRILPDFNILSTSNSGPWLVTRVPRAVWTLRNPATGRVLYGDDRADTQGPSGQRYWAAHWTPNRYRPRDIQVTDWRDGHVLINDTLYAVGDHGALTAIAHDVRDRLRDGHFLQRIEGRRYRRINASGQPVDDTVYTEGANASFRDPRGDTVTLPRTNVYQDGNGRDYLFPDLSRPLPATLPDYRFADGQRVALADLFRDGVALFAPVAHSPWFVVAVPVDRPGASWLRPLTFFFDGNGQWAPDWQPRPGIYSLRDDGRMLFRLAPPYGVLGPDLAFKPLPMAELLTQHVEGRYFIGEDSHDRRGIYDIQAQRWTVHADQRHISRYAVAPDVAVYWQRTGPSAKKRERSGLLDMRTGRSISPPIYDRVDDDGRVTRTENGRTIHFYIDLHTGRPYRAPAEPAPAADKQPAKTF